MHNILSASCGLLALLLHMLELLTHPPSLCRLAHLDTDEIDQKKSVARQTVPPKALFRQSKMLTGSLSCANALLYICCACSTPLEAVLQLPRSDVRIHFLVIFWKRHAERR